MVPLGPTAVIYSWDREVDATDRLWIVLWLPIAMSIYALAGFLLGWGQTISWAVIALAYIAGGRAANLRQMLGDGI
jgi:hypothetical protein